MKWFRRKKEPQKERYIVTTISYYDPLAAQRLMVIQDMLAGREIEPDDPRMKAFDDPYWAGNGKYDPQNPDNGIDGGQYGPQKGNYSLFSKLQARYEDPFLQMEREIDAMEGMADRLMSYDPIGEMDDAIETMEAGIECLIRQTEEAYRNPVIPPHARLLHYSVGIEERNRQNG